MPRASMLASSSNPLAGVPLRYLIGADGVIAGKDGELFFCGYDARTPPAKGLRGKYLNLYREDGEPPEYGPYLTKTRTAAEYDEGVPDPAGMGFWRNVNEQLAAAAGFDVIETDNRDAYRNSAVRQVFDRAAARGLGVLCKNPGVSDHDEDSVELLKHAAVVGTITEEGDVMPADLARMRVAAGKPELPAYFVAFGADQRAWAERCAAQIKAARYVNMSVTWSPDGEYTGVDDILLPIAAAPAPAPVRSIMAQPTTYAGKIIAAMERKGHRVDRGEGEVNIVYVEGFNADGTANDNRPNVFNDMRFAIGFVGGVPKILGAWEATTEPSRRWTIDPMNPKGAARISFGQFRSWQVGMHRGDHEALVQTGGPVTVFRDLNQDYKREGDAPDTGDFGINQHWGYDLPSDDIGSASAGCMVGRTREGHRQFMAIVKSDPRYDADRSFVFTTTIMSAADVLGDATTAAAPAVVPAATTEQRLRMAAAIVGFEARRDKQGRLAVYELPSGDGGGSYEVAGINERYHPDQAAKLKALIEAGRYDEAERSIVEYLVAYTDVVVGWSSDPGVEFYLRDCAFNRGPTGAAYIVQRAVGVDEDGVVGPKTKAAIGGMAPAVLLHALRTARESYERNPVGRDESSKFWVGLVNRWNNALAAAQAFSAEAPQLEPAPQPEPINPVPAPRAPTPAPTASPWQPAIDELIKAIKERRMPSDATPVPRAPAQPQPAAPAIDWAALVQQLAPTLAPVAAQLMPSLLERVLGGAPAPSPAAPAGTDLARIIGRAGLMVAQLTGQAPWPSAPAPAAAPRNDTTGLGTAITGWMGYIGSILGGIAPPPDIPQVFPGTGSTTGSVIATALTGFTALAGTGRIGMIVQLARGLYRAAKAGRAANPQS